MDPKKVLTKEAIEYLNKIVQEKECCDFFELPINIQDMYVTSSILKTHRLYIFNGHHILIPERSIIDYEHWYGFTLDDEEVERCMYIGYGNVDMSECTMTDEELSRVTDYSINVTTEHIRNDCFTGDLDEFLKSKGVI